MKKEKSIYPRSVEEMMCIVEEAEEKGCLLETLIEEFTRHPFSMPVLWKCRNYFYKLDMNDCMDNPVLLPNLALLASMEGKLEEAEQYVGLLGEISKDCDSEGFTHIDELISKDSSSKGFNHIDEIILKTELIMPYISDAKFLRIVFQLVRSGRVPMMGLTLSACRPSILNGFRDFTRYGRYLEQYKDLITETAHKLYGNVGKNVYEIVLAEWYYQKNNCFNALVLVTGTIPLIEQESDMRCLFVALALQMKILLVNGQTRTAKPLVEKIRSRIRQTGWEELTSSLNALDCLAACYDGCGEKITEWLEKYAPDENDNLYMMDMYAWFIKVRCYIQMQKYMAAFVLVNQLVNLLTPGRRYMDLCECHMLLAVIYFKMNDKKHMIEELEKALVFAKKYNYIRLLADEGNCMVQMLKIYQSEKSAESFTDEVIVLAAEVGRYFPDYLKSPADYYEPLTATESTVLKIMAQGKSNDEIAERLGKKTGTIKYHTNNIFRKLHVSNRKQAVERAREINLL